MLRHLILVNYATVTLMVCLLLFIISNSYFEKQIRRLFLLACLLVLCLVIVDSVEYWTATFDHATSLEYGCRPLDIVSDLPTFLLSFCCCYGREKRNWYG